MRKEIKQLLPSKSEPSEYETNEQLQSDVFLCHNSQEKPQVEKIRDQLKQYGIYARLDKYDFEPSRPWQDQLEKIISQIKAVVIFIGSSEVGPWANIEMKEFLVEFTKRKIPMALVILPDYPHQEPQDVPRFLNSFHKIDFRLSSPDPMGQLIWGITGKKPETIMEVISQQSDDLSSDRNVDYDRAIIDYNQALKLDPHYVYAYNGRGNAYLDLKDYDRAIADFNQAIKLDPNYVYAYNGRGNAYLDLKDYDRAIADFNQAIKLDPNYVYAYNGRGNAYLDLKDYDRAIADFNQAIKLDPHYVDAYNWRGVVYKNLKDYDRAIADYNQAIKLDPKYVYAYYNRGNAYLDLKDYDRAIADYNQAIKLDPNLVYPYNGRGNAYLDLKDYDRAIADYNQAIKLDSNYANAYYGRGLICKNQGNKDKAVEDFKKFLELSNDVEWNQKAKQHLQELGTF